MPETGHDSAFSYETRTEPFNPVGVIEVRVRPFIGDPSSYVLGFFARKDIDPLIDMLTEWGIETPDGEVEGDPEFISGFEFDDESGRCFFAIVRVAKEADSKLEEEDAELETAGTV